MDFCSFVPFSSIIALRVFHVIIAAILILFGFLAFNSVYFIWASIVVGGGALLYHGGKLIFCNERERGSMGGRSFAG